MTCIYSYIYNAFSEQRSTGPPACCACRRRKMSNVKQDVEWLLNRLPDNVSVEDIQYHLYVLDKVRRGLEDARVNGTLTQEEVVLMRPRPAIRIARWKTGSTNHLSDYA
jgi:hypothetical protein